MSLITGTLPNLINGVSQQPPSLRLTTACQDQTNCWPSVVSGLQKRNPTQHVADLDTLGNANDAMFHAIDRDGSNRFFVVATPGDLKVYDINGVAKNVLFPDGKSYLSTVTRPSQDLKMVTVGDYTFVLNRRCLVHPYDFGEAGNAETPYEPDGEAATKALLPTDAELGDVYFVEAESAYYRWEAGTSTSSTVIWREAKYEDIPGLVGMTGPMGWFPDSVIEYDYLSIHNFDSVGANLPTTPASANLKVYIERLNGGRMEYKAFISEASTSSAPVSSWKLRSLAELTVIENNRKNPDTLATVHITQSLSNSYYAIYINNILKASFLTNNGTSAEESVEATDVIAAELADGLVASSVNCIVTGSTITIGGLTKNDSVRVTAANGDRAAKAYREYVQSFSNLPPNEIDGRIVRIMGDQDEQGDDYFVMFDAKKGVWIETVAYHQAGGINSASMPHVLIRNEDGSWTFKKHSWKTRDAGDRESNPHPSFVNQTISDIFIYGNRFGILADENVILSEADVFENFYRTSLALVLDSDPIDLAVMNNAVDYLRHAIPYDKDILLTAETSQFRFQYQNYLGPKNAAAKYTTSFNVSPTVRPIAMGSSVYFVDDREGYRYARIWEYFPKDDVSSDDAENMAAQIPEYIPSGVRVMAGSPRVQSLALITDGAPTSLFVYKYYWAGDRKIQTAWGRFDFPQAEKLFWCGFMREHLYILIKRFGRVFFERMRFDEDVFTVDSDYTVLIDRLYQPAPDHISFNAVTNRTTITIPYKIDAGNVELITNSETALGVRHTIKVETSTALVTTVSILGDYTGATVFAGIPYQMRYDFSPFYARQTKGQGEVVILDGRLQIRYLTVAYNNTNHFKIWCKLPGRDVTTGEFSALTAGNSDTELNKISFQDGSFKFAIMGRNTESKIWLTNDAPFPCSFSSAEWLGTLAMISRQRL